MTLIKLNFNTFKMKLINKLFKNLKVYINKNSYLPLSYTIPFYKVFIMLVKFKEIYRILIENT
jgi:hypothetical protein